MTKPYVCYILGNESGRNSYVGITNNIERRIRQHNGEIKGGAKRTRGRGMWTVKAHVAGFRDKSHALSFEWHMHHPRPRVFGGVQGRISYAKKLIETHQRFHSVFLQHSI